MRRPERTSLSAAAQRELDALDAALAGEEVSAEDARTAELATALRELRPGASEEFIHSLDARAAQGFARRAGDAAHKPRRVWRAWQLLQASRARTMLLRPAAGVALATIVALAVALPLLASGGHREARRPVPVPQFSAPATPEPAPPTAALQRGEAASEGETSAKRASASPATATNAPSSSGGSGTRLVERAATLDVGVAPGAIQSSAQRVFTLVSAFGGYVRQSSVSSGEPSRRVEPLREEEGQRGGASFDIRVPSANLSSAIAALAHLGHVRSENNTTNDVTDQHSSLRSALGDAQAERSGLLAQLRKATAEAEIAQLKARLHALDERIGQLQGQLRALDQRVTYTSLALSLTPEAANGGGAGGGDLTPGGAAHDAASILEAALAVVVIAAAAMLPIALVAIAAWVAIAATRRRLREQALDAG